jgi:hypothetical protein
MTAGADQPARKDTVSKANAVGPSDGTCTTNGKRDTKIQNSLKAERMPLGNGHDVI